MSGLPAIYDEIANTLDLAFAADAELVAAKIGVQVWPRMLFNPSSPCFDMYPGAPFDIDTRGFGDIASSLFVELRLRLTGDQQADQDFMLRCCDEEDALCVEDILMVDQTLNGLLSSIYVTRPSQMTQFIDAGRAGQMVGILWQIALVNAIT